VPRKTHEISSCVHSIGCRLKLTCLRRWIFYSYFRSNLQFLTSCDSNVVMPHRNADIWRMINNSHPRDKQTYWLTDTHNTRSSIAVVRVLCIRGGRKWYLGMYIYVYMKSFNTKYFKNKNRRYTVSVINSSLTERMCAIDVQLASSWCNSGHSGSLVAYDANKHLASVFLCSVSSLTEVYWREWYIPASIAS